MPDRAYLQSQTNISGAVAPLVSNLRPAAVPEPTLDVEE